MAIIFSPPSLKLPLTTNNQRNLSLFLSVSLSFSLTKMCASTKMKSKKKLFKIVLRLRSGKMAGFSYPFLFFLLIFHIFFFFTIQSFMFRVWVAGMDGYFSNCAKEFYACVLIGWNASRRFAGGFFVLAFPVKFLNFF